MITLRQQDDCDLLTLRKYERMGKVVEKQRKQEEWRKVEIT